MTLMIEFDPYQTLAVNPSATLAEIKQAYRLLAKQFHPDSQHERANHEQITRINAAYALLKDPRRRQNYDYFNRNGNRNGTRNGKPVHESDLDPVTRHQRTQETQNLYRQDRQTRKAADDHFQAWIQGVYGPVNQELNKITQSLKAEITALADDPYDDELMDEFQIYLETCRTQLNFAQQVFRSMPNPANVAGVAAHLYYSLNHIEDGLVEFEWFTQSYEDSYIASGQEMFRKSAGLRREAQVALEALQAMF